MGAVAIALPMASNIEDIFFQYLECFPIQERCSPYPRQRSEIRTRAFISLSSYSCKGKHEPTSWWNYRVIICSRRLAVDADVLQNSTKAFCDNRLYGKLG